jgi:hypothetical protein
LGNFKVSFFLFDFGLSANEAESKIPASKAICRFTILQRVGPVLLSELIFNLLHRTV